MHLPMKTLILPAAALMIAFAPHAQAANLASLEFQTQANKLLHPIVQKQLRSKKSAANQPKGNPLRHPHRLARGSANPNRLSDMRH
ncbi:MAG: hypothetical protein WBX25_16350 [Rhodomicrobium sp.]